MGIERGRGRRAAGMAAAAVMIGAALVAGAAGCSADSDAGSTNAAADGPAAGAAQQDTAADPGTADQAAADPAADAAKTQEDGTPAGAGAAGQPARFRADERSIVYTGSMTVRVDAPNAAAGKAIALVAGAGGFVGSDKRTAHDGHSEATLVLRVPAAKFTTVVDQLARDLGGKEQDRALNTEDVTEQVVDIDARIASQQASVNRTRTLLASARTVAEIVSVEGELARREAELASLQAKQRRLGDLTALSTITLTLVEPTAPDATDPEDSGFLAGLKAGWSAFVASMKALLTVLGALLPWLLILGLPVAGVLWYLRRRARRATALTDGPPQGAAADL